MTGGPLQPFDLALLSPDPDGPRFFTFRGNFDAYRCFDGGPSRETATNLSFAEMGRGYAFGVERISVNAAPWPAQAVMPPPEYILGNGGLFVSVPLPFGERTPYIGQREQKDATVFMNIVATPSDEAAGRELLRTLGVRALLGRVIEIISLEMGYGSSPLHWRAKSELLKTMGEPPKTY